MTEECYNQNKDIEHLESGSQTIAQGATEQPSHEGKMILAIESPDWYLSRARRSYDDMNGLADPKMEKTMMIMISADSVFKKIGYL